MGWADATRIGIHQKADELRTKINLMNSWLGRFEADRLAAKGPTNDAHSPAPPDVTIGTDTALQPAASIPQCRQSSAIASATLAIQSRGYPLAQSFMRSLFIVVTDPARRAPLLAAGCGRGRRGYFGFVNAMHLFMRAIVLRPPSARKFDSDSQSQPPSREAAQVQGAIASKGPTVIDADHFGLAIARKKPLEILAHRLVFETQQPNTQKIATEQITHRQRIDSLPVPRAEPTFEIHSPHVIGLLRDCQRAASQPRSTPCPSGASLHQFQLLEPFGHGAHLRQASPWMLLAQMGINLFAAPGRMLPAHLHQAPEPPGRRSAGRSFGPLGAILQIPDHRKFENA